MRNVINFTKKFNKLFFHFYKMAEELPMTL